MVFDSEYSRCILIDIHLLIQMSHSGTETKYRIWRRPAALYTILALASASPLVHARLISGLNNHCTPRRRWSRYGFDLFLTFLAVSAIRSVPNFAISREIRRF
jgi:hypothetical protein